jgi:hypothetical protein
MESSQEMIVVCRWNFQNRRYELGLFTEYGECQDSWELVPGEEIPKILLQNTRRCTYGAFSFGETICWHVAPVSEFVDAKCLHHIDKRMLCSMNSPGRAVGRNWECTEDEPLCPQYQRCLSERVCYFGVFAENEVDVIKLGETDDYETRGFLQGLAAIIPIYRRDGGKMSLMKSKLVERELSLAAPKIFLNGKCYRIETKPFTAPYKRKTPAILLAFLNANPDECTKLVERLATLLLEEARRRNSSNELLRDLSLGSPHPCFVDSDADLVDFAYIKKLCQEPSMLEEGKLRLKAPRKKEYFGGDVLSGKPPHIITYIRSNFLGNEVPFMLSMNPNRLNGYEATLSKTLEQSTLSTFLGENKK